MKFITKKSTATFLAAMTLFSVVAFNAYAGTASVHLTPNQGANETSSVYGHYKIFWGNNSSTSERNVYLIAKYKKLGVWYEDISYDLYPGRSIGETKTNYFNDERDWLVRLNVKGVNQKGCDAWGYIRET